MSAKPDPRSVLSDLLAIASGRAEREVVRAAAHGEPVASISVSDLAELALYGRQAAVLLDTTEGGWPLRITARDLGLDAW